MKIISPRHKSKVFYDKFSAGFLVPDGNLTLIDQFHKNNQFSMTLQEYELSKELVIWLSSDLFSELQFDDVWLVFSKLEKLRAEFVFAILKTRLDPIYRQKTPRLLKEKFYMVIDELEKELIKPELIPALV